MKEEQEEKQVGQTDPGPDPSACAMEGHVGKGIEGWKDSGQTDRETDKAGQKKWEPTLIMNTQVFTHTHTHTHTHSKAQRKTPQASETREKAVGKAACAHAHTHTHTHTHTQQE